MPGLGSIEQYEYGRSAISNKQDALWNHAIVVRKARTGLNRSTINYKVIRTSTFMKYELMRRNILLIFKMKSR